MKSVKNTACRACDGTGFDTVIDLGEQPLVNSLIRKEDFDKKEPLFPLVVKRCRTCGLVQLTEVLEADEIYKNVDYLFFSSDMPTLAEYFREYADDVKKRFLKEGDFVVEMGSNDGILLEFFKDEHRILGVDPATNVVLRALKRGIPTVSEFFTERLANLIVKEFGPAKVFIANSCVAHVNDPQNLMRGVKAVLAKDGVFAAEVNYWGAMVKNTNYSLIYHDHFSYFSLKNVEDLAAQFGMRVFDAWVTPSQNYGMLRVFLDNGVREATPRLLELRKEEAGTALHTLEACKRFEKNVRTVSKKLRTILEELKKKGKRLAGYGASAKGLIILRCAGVGKNLIDYFVDDSPAKQGWFTPVDRIPIISRAEAEKNLPDYFVILAPNYAKVIIEKEKKFRDAGGKFVVPVGEIDII